MKVSVCCGMECTARGGQELMDTVESDPRLRSAVSIAYEQCMDMCGKGDLAPVVIIEGTIYTSMTADKLSDLLLALIEPIPAKGGS